MKATQDLIQKFNDDREWSNPSAIKDLLLNMNEEIGEFWNIIKWVDTEKQQELIKQEKPEVENFIGDMIYLIPRLEAELLRKSFIFGAASPQVRTYISKAFDQIDAIPQSPNPTMRDHLLPMNKWYFRVAAVETARLTYSYP